MRSIERKSKISPTLRDSIQKWCHCSITIYIWFTLAMRFEKCHRLETVNWLAFISQFAVVARTWLSLESDDKIKRKTCNSNLNNSLHHTSLQHHMQTDNAERKKKENKSTKTLLFFFLFIINKSKENRISYCWRPTCSAVTTEYVCCYLFEYIRAICCRHCILFYFWNVVQINKPKCGCSLLIFGFRLNCH